MPLRSGAAPGRTPAGNDFPQAAASGYPRDFLDNHFVYLVVSPRAHGLCLGVNLNPVPYGNLNCLDGEADRAQGAPGATLEMHRMVMELRETLELVRGGWLRQWSRYARLPAELLNVRHVALSGDREPTLARQFVEAVRAVVRLRARDGHFKIVLSTDATALDQAPAQQGLALLGQEDEVWAQLDGGTQAYLDRINGAAMPLAEILRNIVLVGRQRPVVIQSLFPALNGEEPPAHEIQAYAQCLKALKEAGAVIPLVQIYSANRPMGRSGCGHLPLRTLSQIAQTVRRVAGLRAEVF